MSAARAAAREGCPRRRRRIRADAAARRALGRRTADLLAEHSASNASRIGAERHAFDRDAFGVRGLRLREALRARSPAAPFAQARVETRDAAQLARKTDLAERERAVQQRPAAVARRDRERDAQVRARIVELEPARHRDEHVVPPELSPTRRSSTASSTASRRWSKPAVTRCGVPSERRAHERLHFDEQRARPSRLATTATRA